MTSRAATRTAPVVTVLGLGLLVVCLLLNLQDPYMPGVGLDPSWMLIVEYAARHDLVFGREIVFTYGPFHYLSTRLFDPATFPLVIAYSILSVTAILWTALVNRSVLALAAITAVFVVLRTFGDALSTIALLAAFLICLQRRDRWSIAVAALCGPLALAKYSLALVILPLLALADLDRLLARRPPLLTLAFLAAALAGNLAARQPIEATADLIRNSLEIILGYGRAMQTTGDKTELAVGLLFALATLVLVGAHAWSVRVRPEADGRPDWRPFLAAAGFAWAMFMLFKMSFVRHDMHTLTFHLGAPLALAVVFGFMDRPGRLPIAAKWLFVIVFVAFSANSLYRLGLALPGAPSPGAELISSLKQITPRLQTGVAWASGRRFEVMRRARAEADASIRRPFAPIVTGAVDAIPWDLAPLIGSGLDYRPRPAIQSYSAYTPTLQALDKAHFQGPNAPDTLLFRMEDIDLRLPSLGAGPTLPVIGQRYDVAGVDPMGLILKRRAVPRQTTARMTAPAPLPLDRWTPAPQAPGRLLMAHIKVERTLAGRLIGFLFREPLMQIDLRTAGGAETSYRFIPDMAQLGVAVSPVPAAWDQGALAMLDPQSTRRSEPLAAVRLKTNGKNWAFKTPTVAYEEITFAPGFAKNMPDTAGGSSEVAAALASLGIEITPNGAQTPVFQTPTVSSDLAICRGSMDLLRPALEAGLWQVSGWAWNGVDGRTFDRIFLVDETKRLVGVALGGGSRPDVPPVIPQVRSPASGWNGAATRGGGRSLSAYGLLDDGRACEIGRGAWPS